MLDDLLPGILSEQYDVRQMTWRSSSKQCYAAFFCPFSRNLLFLLEHKETPCQQS